METYICVMSKRGLDLGRRIQKELYPNAILYAPSDYIEEEVLPYPGEKSIQGLGILFDRLQSSQMYESNRMIFIMAMGIALRGINGHMKSKMTDPSCILMDEQGDFVISLLSGHLGGANEDTERIASHLGGQSVVTTATDRAGVAALDTLVKSLRGYCPDFKKHILEVNKRLAAGKKVGLYSEYNQIDRRGFLWVDSLENIPPEIDYLVLVSHKQVLPQLPTDVEVVRVYPKSIIIGTGAKKDLDAAIYEESFYRFLAEENIGIESIQALVSIDKKKEETCILQLASRYGIPFWTYTKEELEPWEKYYPTSDFVRSQVGVGSVAQASVHQATKRQALSRRYSYQGSTFAYGKSIE